MENIELEFGTEELNKIVENVGNSNFAKFEVGKPYVVEVISPKIMQREVEFDGKVTTRYDIKVKIADEEKVWSVSKTVLKTISDNWDTTKRFNVMRGEGSKGYNVIPLITV